MTISSGGDPCRGLTDAAPQEGYTMRTLITVVASCWIVFSASPCIAQSVRIIDESFSYSRFAEIAGARSVIVSTSINKGAAINVDESVCNVLEHGLQANTVETLQRKEIAEAPPGTDPSHGHPSLAVSVLTMPGAENGTRAENRNCFASIKVELTVRRPGQRWRTVWNSRGNGHHDPSYMPVTGGSIGPVKVATVTAILSTPSRAFRAYLHAWVDYSICRIINQDEQDRCFWPSGTANQKER